MFAVVTIGAVWFVATEQARWWLAVVPIVALLVLSLTEPRRLSRRLGQLES